MPKGKPKKADPKKKKNSSRRSRLSVKSAEKTHVEPLCVGEHKKKLILLFRGISPSKTELRLSHGSAGGAFSSSSNSCVIVDGKNKKEDVSRATDFRLSSAGDKIVLTYLRHSEKGPSLVYAESTDGKKWKIKHVFSEIKSPAVAYGGVSDFPDLYFGDHVLKIASFVKSPRAKAPKWAFTVPPRVPYWHFFEGVPFRTAGALRVLDAIAVFYSAEHTVDIMKDVALRDEKVGEERLLKIGMALFAEESKRLLWQTELPIVEAPIETGGSIRVLGAVLAPGKGRGKKAGSVRVYVSSAGADIGYVDIPEEALRDHKERAPAELMRAKENPILSPSHLEWERDGTFNPAAIYLNGRVHLLYRAAGADGFSKIGYASSKDGVHIDERLTMPIYTPKYWFEYKDERGEVSPSLFESGGGWGGCEDPKATVIGDRVYMTYVAHTGVWPTRTVLTSISVDDFLNKRWKWTKPQLMSPPGVGSKSVVIMPEKIDGKYVIFHRRWPNIYVDMVDKLEFGEGKQWLSEKHMIRTRKSYWDSQKMSVGGTPIKTKDGWLVIYNAVDRLDSSKYKLGAMLLDLQHPQKVLSRTRKPILSPEEFYENDGKPGVAYPGGNVLIGDDLYVYYGGADKVSCVAKMPVREIISVLKKNMKPEPRIHHAVLPKTSSRKT